MTSAASASSREEEIVCCVIGSATESTLRNASRSSGVWKVCIVSIADVSRRLRSIWRSCMTPKTRATSSVSAVATFATVFRSISMVSGLLTVAEAYGVHMTPGDVLSTLKQANTERNDVAKRIVRDHIRAELPPLLVALTAEGVAAHLPCAALLRGVVLPR